ncbi:MAG: acyl carrier protein [Lachnospiraceae bacterium]|nr:acyl carrier protein [Lachnospiraceae bacterium]MBQ6995630.1 acyl carrier protein [Lachnospiraceae bacterium]
MREQVLKVLTEIREDVDFENETKLIDDGILDSFDIISIVSELNEKFFVEITADELEPDNFNTLDAIVALVESLQ